MKLNKMKCSVLTKVQIIIKFKDLSPLWPQDGCNRFKVSRNWYPWNLGKAKDRQGRLVFVPLPKSKFFF